MAKTKKSKTPKLLTIYRHRPPHKVGLFFLISIGLIVGAISFYSIFSSGRSNDVPGQLQTPDTNQEQAADLDLRETAKAHFDSASLTLVRTAGVIGNIKTQVVSFPVRVDNLNEYALMTLPNSPAPPNGYPVIILCHGFYSPSKYKTLSGYTADMAFYSQHGFAVIKPDYRGQGLSKDEGSPDGAFYSTAYNTDVMSLITAVGQTPYLNESNISLWGHSMGAYIALRAAVLSPEVKKLIILSGPVDSLEEMFTSYAASSDAQNPTALKVRQQVFLKYGTPATNPNLWYWASPTTYLNNLSAKVQIHVGTADTVVPPKFSADFNQMLKSAGKNPEYYVYRGAKHGLLNQRSIIWERSLEFLQSPS